MISAVATVIGAAISGIVAVIVSRQQYNKTLALVLYRLEELEKKVDKHNNLVERIYKLEAKVEANK